MVKNNRNKTRHSMNIVPLAKELGFALFMLAVVLVLRPGHASAATINVATGSSAPNADSICQLEEAIRNINDGARTEADCVETGSYGTNDTINLPAGTITGQGTYLGSSLDTSTKIIGQGRNTSIVENGIFQLSGSGLTTFELQDFSMVGYGVNSNNAIVTIDRMDIDLDGSNNAAVMAMHGDVTVRDSWFHNAEMSGSGLYGLVYCVAMGNPLSLSIERTTLSHAGRGVSLIAGSGFDLDAEIKNTTFTDMSGDANALGSAGMGIFAYVSDTNSSVTYTTTNNTFSNMSNPTPGDFPATAILEVADDGLITHTAQNDLYAVGDGTDDAVNFYRVAGSGSSVAFTTTSDGGNVSSDDSYSTYLTESTDQHEVTSLASFLGALTDNGGEVPTLALLEGSPAINAGTDVLGMTTDARGVARPQAGAFDAGAYESAFGATQGDGDQNSGDNSGGGNGTQGANGSNGGGSGALGETGQHTKSLLAILSLALSAGLATIFGRRKLFYKRR